MQDGHSSSIAANGLAKPRDGLKQLLPLAIGAIGVVYGDIGTSPLYTLRLCFRADGPLPLTPDHIVGILSLIFWSVTMIVTLKYATIIMRADNQGQGGILSWEDLAGYAPKLREPLRGHYRGFEVLAFPPLRAFLATASSRRRSPC
jgi:K+ transporter